MPEREADTPERDWGSSVLRDLGLGPEPAPEPDPSPGPGSAPAAASDPGAAASDPGAAAEAGAVDSRERPSSGSATLPHRGAAPGARALEAAPLPAGAAEAAAPAPAAPGPVGPVTPAASGEAPPADPAAPEESLRGPGSDDLDPERFTRARHHRDPLVRQAARRVREALGVGASREVREATARAGRLRQPVTTIRRIAVLSGRGGAGKTTVAALVATALAAARPDRVLAVDAAPDLGSLALVAGASSPRPPAAFARAAPQPQTFEDADPHLGRTDGGLWLLTGPTGPTAPGSDPRLDLPAYRTAVAALSRFFAVLVTDCGPDPASPLNLGVLEDAHALALVAPATVDGLVSTHQAIARLRQTSASLLPRTVVVLSAQTPHGEAVDLKRGTRTLASQGVRVARLPYDRHLAAGARLRPDLLGERTTTAVIGLAADLLDFAVSDRGGW
jgi:MinD-like ATPase involved in chromosome partitioning or flagellar assembly